MIPKIMLGQFRLFNSIASFDAYKIPVLGKISQFSLLLLASFLLGQIPMQGALATTPPSIAPSIADENEDVDQDIDQVTSVSQLSDVAPTDWAFQALQSLVERYGCIAGYPDGTYRGNRSLTRYEFAAGVNACLDQINRLIASSVADAVTREDLIVLQKLQEEFAVELANLRGRVDTLEARTTELEANQFSTTTKLFGEAIFSVSSIFGEENAKTGDDLTDNNATVNYRVRLNFATSFSGQDLLLVRLQGRNTNVFQGGTNMTDLSWAGGNENGEVKLSKLFYRFPVNNNRTRFWLTAVGLNMDDVVDPLNPIAYNDSTSDFGAYSSIYKNSFGTGVGVNHQFNDRLALGFGYVANNAPNPVEGNGFFSGGFNAFSQLTYQFKSGSAIALAYGYTYFLKKEVFIGGYDGSLLGEDPFNGAATTSHNIALNTAFYLGKNAILSGWVQYSKATGASGDREGDTADIWTWATSLTFNNLFAPSNTGGFIVGSPPKAYHVEGGPEDKDWPLHLEAFYKFRVNDNIFISPGVFVVTNPEDGRDPIWVGAIRTNLNF